ncbi:NmrA family NAD(P)-binding protein [Kocuria arenosa]|uniref:NmrA family NAD(P)-binding protein n=1 Tax=Kocuria arenosa TaxID=3071446 RepID=UPI0034D7A70B
MTTTPVPPPVLVTGGTGRTGTRLARRLIDLGVPVRIGSRRAPVPFDWHDSSTWAPALDGVRAAYLCYSPDLAFPGVPELIAALGEAAARAGVQRVVLLSGRGEDGARATEDAVQASGPAWTVLRCSWFAQNFSEHFLLGPVRRGRLLLPADGDIAEPFLDLEDLAEVAADALTDERHLNRLLELTGPRLLTLHQVAAELSTATGRPIEFAPCTPQQFATDLAQDGIPAQEALPLAGLFTEILDGRNASLSTDLTRVLDREPTDFTTYATRTAATGIWTTPATQQVRP